MKKVWKLVGIICCALIAAGIVIALAGYITGASPDRMIENVFGSREEMDMIVNLLRSEIAGAVTTAVP